MRRLAVYFFVLCPLLLVESYTPIVYPSLYENHGLVFDEGNNRVISVAGGIDPLLCAGSSDEDDPIQGVPGCSNVVVFTSRDSMTLQILNLTSSTIIQPILSVPEITLTGGRIKEVNTYGAQGTRVVEEVEVELIEDDSERAEELLFENEAEAPGSESEDGEDDFEIGDDDVVESLTDIAPATENIPTAILDLNETRNLLTADGEIRPEHALVMEVSLVSLPERELVTVELTFEGGIRRVLLIFRDSARVRSSINYISERAVGDSDETREFFYRVRIWDTILNTPDRDMLECPEIREPLEKFSSRYLTHRGQLEARELTAMVDARAEFSTCGDNFMDRVNDGVFQVRGANNVDKQIPSQPLPTVAGLREGTRQSTSLEIRFRLDMDLRHYVTIESRPGVAIGLSGLPIDGESVRYRIERPNRATVHSIQNADELGKTSTAMASTSVVTGVATTIGASMAASVIGSAAAQGAGGSLTMGGSLTGAVELIGAGQRIYLISIMPIPNMPENFQTFGNSLSWTMLDIKVPWRGDKNSDYEIISGSNNPVPDATPQPSAASSMASTDFNSSDTELEIIAQGSQSITVVKKEWPYERLVLAFSWAALLFVCLVIVHCTLIGIFFTFRIKLPDQLRFPRMELYLFYWTTPAIAGACASLFTGNRNAILLGVALLCLFPLPFVLWHIYILANQFFFKRPEKYTVFFEVGEKQLDSLTGHKGYVVGSGKIPKPEAETVIPEVIEKYIVTPLIGPPYVSGDWKTVEGPRNKFVGRFGPIFEDFRYIAGLRRDATYEVEQNGKQVKRGSFVPVSRDSAASVIRVSGTLLALVRTIFVACFILGADNPDTKAQAMTLLCISGMFLIVHRVYRPQTKRWKVALAMSHELLSIATFATLIYLIDDDEAERQDKRRRFGILLMSFESIGYFLNFMDQLFTSGQLIWITSTAIWNYTKPAPRLAKIVQEAQVHNPRYLERKYFRRWVTNTLGRGIYYGALKGGEEAPFEELFWADPIAALRHFLTIPCFGENAPPTPSNSRSIAHM